MPLTANGLKGSELLDTFKLMHKVRAPSHYYGLDVDFALLDRAGKFLAFIDVKHPRDELTWAELRAYEQLDSVAPVYIVVSADTENGPFRVREWKPGCRQVVDCRDSFLAGDWADLVAWEAAIRGELEGPPKGQTVEKGADVTAFWPERGAGPEASP